MCRQRLRCAWFVKAMVLGVVPLIAGCAAPLLGGITLNHIFAATSATTTAWSGKGLSELILDQVTGKDCRFLDGALREDRDLCEPEGAAATEEDFKGVTSVVNYVRAMQRPKDEDIVVVDGTTIRLGDIETAAGEPEAEPTLAGGSKFGLGSPLAGTPDPLASELRLMPATFARDF